MKRIHIIIACISASIGSYAQTNIDIIPPQPIEQSKFSIGVKGAFGHSFLMPYSDPSFLPSRDAGLSAIFSPYKHLGFGIDATYSREGVKFETPEYTSTTELKYVRLPVKVIYFFRDYDKDFRPKIAIGPTIGFLTNKGDNSAYNTTDVGVNASLGFNYRLLRAVWLNIDASYYQGLTDIYKSNNERDLNGNARLNLGLSFGF